MIVLSTGNVMEIGIVTGRLKHRKNCECCPCHSLFKGHKVIVYIIVLNCQQCKQFLEFKCQVTRFSEKLKMSSKNL